MGQQAAVLAVDGGNSKADLALLGEDGTLLAVIRRPGFSHQVVGLARAATGLAAAADALRQAAGRPVGGPLARVGAFCLAGADLPIDDDRLGAMLEDAGLVDRWLLRNDVFAVLRAGTDGGAGVAVVCGAGMNCVGVAPDGRSIRYPALGAISGDLAAGGGWLGLHALAAAVRVQDGRGAASLLAEVVPAHFGLRRPLDVTEALYTGHLEESQLVELAPTVFRCAAEGDEVAGGLVRAVADEVVTTVRATMERLDLTDGSVPVVLGGGLFRAGDGALQRLVTDGVLAVAPSADVRVLSEDPVLGAALLGFDELRASDAVKGTVRARFAEARIAGDEERGMD